MYNHQHENNSVLVTNLNALSEKNPELGLMIERDMPSGEFYISETPSTAPTLLYIPSTGNARYLHSPEDPVREACGLIKDRSFRGEDITVLFGFGLGYLPLAIRDRMHPEHVLVIVEASRDVLHKALSTISLSELLQDSRVHLLAADQKNQLRLTLDQYRLKILAGKVQKLVYPPCIDLAPESYKKMESWVESFIRFVHNYYFAIYKNEECSTENFFKNLSLLNSAAPVNCLEGIAKNRSVIVVAAGPSLDKNINTLQEANGKAIVIAVDSALKPLSTAGILPDIIVSVDPSEANLKKFHSIPNDIFDQIVPVFSFFVHYKIPRIFSKNRFFFNEPGDLNSWFLETTPPIVQFPKGNSVSHYAFSLAKFMSPLNIIFVGLDLSFPFMQAHSKHSDSWSLSPDINYVLTPDIHGGYVPTIPAFRDAITVLESQIAATNIPCIDATEGGALIEGTRIMSLTEVLDRFVSPSKNARIDFPRIWEQAEKIDSSRISGKVEEFITSAQKVRSLSKQGMDTISSLLKDIHAYGPKDSRVTQKIEDVNHLVEQIDAHKLYMALIRQRLDSIIINQYRTKFMGEREKNNKKRLLIQIDASREYFSRIHKATIILIRYGEKAVKPWLNPSCGYIEHRSGTFSVTKSNGELSISKTH
ncbi:MAG: motility associated factor glycosyltransferase family protein [Deltaproteobacteria bacterium]|nr:motility associated factor glycosyltransferase family protein [Deltaproteobacteria bacterium]MBW2153511.1 motility associated factor glycosyltransferase family protein [Deltaproteobacteria bacterium]